jgi:CHAP domain
VTFNGGKVHKTVVALALVAGGVGVAEPSRAATAKDVVSAAQSQLGVREVPENRGPRVREYQKSVKNDHYALDAPWCASFVTWAGLQANDPTPFRSAIVSEWIVAADKGRHGMSFVRQSSVRAGDIVALKKGGKWQHMGIVSSVSNGITVISGNTVAPDKKADGVFEKPLSNWTKKGYVATFIRNSG